MCYSLIVYTERLKRKSVYVAGSVDYVNPNYVYIISQTYEQGIWVHQRNLATALDKDQVKVVIIHPVGADRRPEGRLIEVLKRDREQFVGRVELFSNFALVIPDSRRMHDNISLKQSTHGFHHSEFHSHINIFSIENGSVKSFFANLLENSTVFAKFESRFL
ncbi:MAG: hypothetical protein MI674_01145 [Cytophagales bacterium]|nr:hypothetical protein [Cytophagales bacterium]